MDRYTIAGVALCAAGLSGYVAGIHVAYPGRVVSVAALMVRHFRRQGWL